MLVQLLGANAFFLFLHRDSKIVVFQDTVLKMRKWRAPGIMPARVSIEHVCARPPNIRDFYHRSCHGDLFFLGDSRESMSVCRRAKA